MQRHCRSFLLSCSISFLIAFLYSPAWAADKTIADRGLEAGFQKALYSVGATPGGFTASNPAQHISERFTGDEARFEYKQDSVGLRLRGYGYGERLLQPEAARLAGNGNRVEYRRGGLTEWYVNRPAGVEQGFTLAQRPGSARPGERLIVAVEVTGGMRPELAPTGDAVLLERDGRARLRYTGLRAWDAADRGLEAWLEVRGREVRLVIADAGAVYPVTVAPAVQQAELLAADGAAGDEFGFSVAVDGNTAVIGATGKTIDRGAAYVFTFNGTVWTQQAELTASDGVAYDYFGYSVAISGDTAVVGAQNRANGLGAAYVFTRSGVAWTQQAELLASDGASGDTFGRSAAVSADTVVIGAYLHASRQGAAYVFTRSGVAWTQRAELLASDGAAGDFFGSSVAVDADTAVIGAYGHANFQGAAYVFTRSGVQWTQQAELLASDGAAGDDLGYSAAVSAGTAVIGAYLHARYQGAAYVFARSGVQWTQQAELSASDGAAGDFFGSSVAANLDTAVIGTMNAANGRRATGGTAYVFTRSAGLWTQQVELTASDGEAQDAFGNSAAVSGNTVVVGAYTRPNSQGASGVGAAYVFDLPVVTVASTPAGLSFTASGAGCPSGTPTTPYALPPGAGSCQISFPSPVQNSADTAIYTFQQWADGNPGNPRQLPAALVDTTFTAQFSGQFLLATTASPSYGGQVTGGGWYAGSTNATVAATATPGYYFAGFSGGLSGTTTPQTLPMSAPLSVTGSFLQLPAAAIGTLISSKSGAQNDRLWTITLTNNGPGVAYAAQIGGLMLTQTYGTACAPQRLSPVTFPVSLSDLNAGGQANATAQINFSGCPANARFTVVVVATATGGASCGATTLANQTM